MPLFQHHAWRDDPGISLTGRTLRQRINIIFPGLIPAFWIYTGLTVGKWFLGYPYLFDGGHKISFTRLFGVGDPHPVMGGHHGGDHGHGGHGDAHGHGHGEAHGHGHAAGSGPSHH